VNDGALDPIVVVEYDPAWPEEFRGYARAVRSVLGPVARRIDHVGSTAVPGLAAKPVIDLQISVDALEPVARYAEPLATLGYAYEARNPDRVRRAFRWPPGERRRHLYARVAGSFDEQLNLLFRDFLRSSPDDARTYARSKQELAVRFRTDREGYVRAKEPAVWSILRRAHDWAQATGWSAGPSDA
jgi:GrpB-like predicted nucleotidyltransferase (UPF0157 family)